MCEWGTVVDLPVTMAAVDSHTGRARDGVKAVDACIADIVRALNAGGVLTSNSCCGHGAANGWILLHDGRRLEVHACRP